MGWFPQQYGQEFLWLEALIAFVATLLLIGHMNRVWSTLTSRGQRWRYRALLASAMLLSFYAGNLAWEEIAVELRHVLGMVVAIVILFSAIISLRDDWRRRR